MPAPDEIAQETPDDGITRIAIEKPFRSWLNPLIAVAILANMASAGYLRGQASFQAASELQQYLAAAACAVVTTLPFAAIYGLWRWRRRRLLRAARTWGDDVSIEVAAGRLFRSLIAAETGPRTRVFGEWLRARGSLNETFVIHWHDEMPAVNPVRTPFEPRPLEWLDTLPVEIESTEVTKSKKTPELVPGFSAAVSGVASNAGSRRAVTFFGMIMVATSLLWVIAQVARALQQRWMVGLLLPLTITFLACIGVWGIRSLLIRDRWFLVPGGVLLRRGKGFGSAVDVQLFDRRKSIALVLEMATEAWLVTLLSGDTFVQRSMTTDHLTHFLRTWLSPLTPPVNRFIDFE